MAIKQLSVSSTSAFLQCPRRFFYSHEMRWIPDTEAPALRFGKAWHSFLEYVAMPMTAPDARGEASYDERVDAFLDARGEALEQMGEDALAMLLAMIRCYEPTFYSVGLVRQVEKPFLFRLPHTQWAIKGFIDAIDFDGCPVEYKTTSSDIAEGSFYWMRLKANLQAVTYALAMNADKVTYVVAKKPNLKRKQVPATDFDGLKIVTDLRTGERAFLKNGAPRQSAGEGYRLETRTETQEEFINRLEAEMLSDNYFVKKELNISDDAKWVAVNAFTNTARQIEILRKRQKQFKVRTDLPWTRNCTEFNCKNCPYQGLCLDIDYNPSQGVPQGFTTTK